MLMCMLKGEGVRKYSREPRQVIGIKSCFEHTCLACCLPVYCMHHLVNRKLGSPAFKVLRKIGGEIRSRTLKKNGDRFNENLSQETIFLVKS